MTDITYFIVIPAEAGIQMNRKIRLFTKASKLSFEILDLKNLILGKEALSNKFEFCKLPVGRQTKSFYG
jgi:hypothetical protein